MTLHFAHFSCDAASRQLWVRGREAHLSPKAFELLALLIERRPHAVSKQDIRERLWPGTFVTESNLPTLISEIREALGDTGQKSRIIRTLHRIGYAFQAADLPARGRAALAGRRRRDGCSGQPPRSRSSTERTCLAARAPM